MCRQMAQQRGGTVVSYTHTQGQSCDAIIRSCELILLIEYAHKVEQQMKIENNKALVHLSGKYTLIDTHHS